MRKQFATSIDTNISDEFRKACDKRDIKMNVVLEAFMKQFAGNEFIVKISKSGIMLEIEEKK